MKEASGDMTMTVVVIIGIVAVLAFASTVIWPAIQDKITGEVDKVGIVIPSETNQNI